jgi:hypothetical protein
MILDNPYHRRKVKKILQENVRLKAEIKEAKKIDFSRLESIIEEQAEEIKTLKKRMQGYKMQIAKHKKRS